MAVIWNCRPRFVPIKATFKLQDIKDAHQEYARSAGVGSIVIEVSQQR
jgi:hypothetical protein